jgi:hypothetical protein
MPALVGSILARLQADSAPLARGLNVGAMHVQRFEKRAGASLHKVDSRIGLLARTGAVGFAQLAKSAALSIAPIISLGAALAGTRSALEEFGRIADASAAAALDPELYQGLAYAASLVGVSAEQSATAFATFAKNAALAQAGTGRLKSQLEKLDPQLLKAIQSARSQEERVRALADALARTVDPAKRSAIAIAALGEAGAKIATAFAGGAAQIDSMMVKARQAGLIIERDLIARADELGDQFDTVTRIVDLQTKQALVNLGPVLVWLTGLAGDLAETIGGVAEAFKPLAEQSTQTLENRLSAAERLAALGLAHGPSPASLEEEAKAIRAILRERAIDNLRRQLTATPPTSTDLPSLGEDDPLASLTASIAPLDIGIAGLTERMDELNEVGAAVAETLSSGLSDVLKALVRGEDAVGALSNAFGRLGDRLIDMAADQAISALLGGLTSAIGPAAGLSRPGSFSIGSIPLYASGTPFHPGGAAIVGEHGPELVTLPHGASVLSASRTADFMRPDMPRLPHARVSASNDNSGITLAPVYNIDARGSNITPAQIKALLEANNKALERDLPKMLANARRRGAA